VNDFRCQAEKAIREVPWYDLPNTTHITLMERKRVTANLDAERAVFVRRDLH
jgi:hypothetical protein